MLPDQYPPMQPSFLRLNEFCLACFQIWTSRWLIEPRTSPSKNQIHWCYNERGIILFINFDVTQSNTYLITWWSEEDTLRAISICFSSIIGFFQTSGSLSLWITILRSNSMPNFPGINDDLEYIVLYHFS